jgi:hypothetical protein
MIISLISSVLGMFGGLLPDIFKEIKASREHGRELERLDKQAELQLKMLQAQTDAKLAEIDANVVVEEMKAFGEQMKAIYAAQKPTGIKWVDGFNAMIRPATAAALMLLFVFTAGAYTWSLIGAIDLSIPDDWGRLSTAIWGSLVGDSIQAVLGYLFGYRTTSTTVQAIRSRYGSR